jgi:hypothetical protein
MSLYAFIRADGFYVLELLDDTSAVKNAECNPGTLQVLNAVTGVEVWRAGA